MDVGGCKVIFAELLTVQPNFRWMSPNFLYPPAHLIHACSAFVPPGTRFMSSSRTIVAKVVALGMRKRGKPGAAAIAVGSQDC